MPRRRDRTPKHPTSTAASTATSPATSTAPDDDASLSLSRVLGRRVRRGVAMTAVVAGVLAGGAAFSGQSPDVARIAAAAGTPTGNPAGTTAGSPTGGPAGTTTLPTPSPAELARLAESRSDSRASRSQSRTPSVAAKSDLLDLEARPGPQQSRTRTVELGDPRDIAQSMIADRGWSQSEFSCLDSLWVKESGWDPRAANPTSSAYGIPQALPGSKMATAGADWETNPATQIAWGLGYIADRYGSPCSAWSHSQANGWY